MHEMNVERGEDLRRGQPHRSSPCCIMGRLTLENDTESVMVNPSQILSVATYVKVLSALF